MSCHKDVTLVVFIPKAGDTPGDFKSPGVPSAAIAIFADCRDRRIKPPISGMSDIGD